MIPTSPFAGRCRRRIAQTLGQGCPGTLVRRDREIRVRVLVLGGGQIAAAVDKAAPRAARGHRSNTWRNSILPTNLPSRNTGGPQAPTGSSMLLPTRLSTARRTSRQLARAVNDTAVGSIAEAARARRHAGCCICRRISCSTAHPDGRTCPTDATQPFERLRRQQTGRRTSRDRRPDGHRAAHLVGVCVSGQEFRPDHAQADARAGTGQRGLRSDRRVPPGPASAAAAIWGLIEARAAGRYLSLDGFGRGELVRFRGCDSRRGARARLADPRRARGTDSRAPPTRRAPSARASACSTPRITRALLKTPGAPLAAQFKDDAG